MAQIKKFALIPEELVAKHTVSSKRLSELDKLMLNILHSDLPDYEKLIRYQELLQKSLNLQEYNNARPVKKEETKQVENSMEQQVESSKEKQVQDSEPPRDHFHDLILSSVSKPMRRKAENALSLIKLQPEVLSWNSKGEISHQGEKIPNSNIIDLFNYMFNSRKILPHKSRYDQALKDLNVPKQFIGNKKLLNTPEKSVKRNMIKRNVKWEKY